MTAEELLRWAHSEEARNEVWLDGAKATPEMVLAHRLASAEYVLDLCGAEWRYRHYCPADGARGGRTVPECGC